MTEAKPVYKIHVIEDDQDFSSALQKRLSLDGFTVSISKTAEDAMLNLAKEEYDCILIDIYLDRKHPETQHGETLIKFIRQNKISANKITPILMMSGSLDLELLRKVKDTIEGAIVKPIDRDTLIKRLIYACEKKRKAVEPQNK